MLLSSAIEAERKSKNIDYIPSWLKQGEGHRENERNSQYFPEGVFGNTALSLSTEERGLLRLLSHRVFASLFEVYLSLYDEGKGRERSSVVLDLYSGRLPLLSSPSTNWILQERALLRLSVIAFRLSVKMEVDATIFGDDIDDDDGFIERVDQLSNDWYIGVEGEEWERAVQNGKRRLFALRRGEGSSLAG